MDGFPMVLETVHSENELWYYEPVMVTIQNDLTGNLSFEENSFHILTYTPNQRIWTDVPFQVIPPATDGPGPLPLTLRSGEEATMVLLPEYEAHDKPTNFRLVVIGSLTSDNENQQEVGSYLDVQIKPAPDMDYSLLSMEKYLPGFQDQALLWRQDAYLAQVHLSIPSKANPGGLVASYTFQSPTDDYSERVFSIDVGGKVFTQENTYPKGLTRNLPIQSDEWLLDGPEVLGLIMQHDPSITWPGDECLGFLLRHPGTRELRWDYYTSDCLQNLIYQYTVDPITGVISEF